MGMASIRLIILKYQYYGLSSQPQMKAERRTEEKD